MVRERLVSRRVLGGIAVLAAATGTGIALWPLHGGGHHTSSILSTATAARGDIVVTVGGVGRVVEARAAGLIAVPAPVTIAGGASTTPSTQTTAPADAVFATATGHLGRFLVAPGRHVTAGEPIAVIDDGTTAAIALDQARSDLATARLELRQKQTSDPTKGPPPTPSELQAARLALRAAAERAHQISHPTLADVTSARLDVSKSQADL
jgi:multidrug efflux pump subunit AcrA (membrane-fusion protein)